MVAAAPEPVEPPHRQHLQPDLRVRLRNAVDRLGQRPRRAVILTADRPARQVRLGIVPRANALGEHPHAIRDHLAILAHRVADNIIVQHRPHMPAARLGRAGKQLAAPQPLLLARQQRIDDRAVEFLPGQHPRRLDHQRRARRIVIGARRIAADVHHIGHATVDMAGDDHHLIGITAPLLDRQHIDHLDAIGRARPGEAIGDRLDAQAAATALADLLELGLAPGPRRTDPAPGVGRARQRMARAKAHQLFHARLQPRRIGRGRRGGGRQHWGCKGRSGGEQDQFLHLTSLLEAFPIR